MPDGQTLIALGIVALAACYLAYRLRGLFSAKAPGGCGGCHGGGCGASPKEGPPLVSLGPAPASHRGARKTV